jgi:hypothetical protein
MLKYKNIHYIKTSFSTELFTLRRQSLPEIQDLIYDRYLYIQQQSPDKEFETIGTCSDSQNRTIYLLWLDNLSHKIHTLYYTQNSVEYLCSHENEIGSNFVLITQYSTSVFICREFPHPRQQAEVLP